METDLDKLKEIYPPYTLDTKYKDLTNIKYGRLLPLYRTTSNSRTKWVCLCDCGNICVADSSNIVAGNTKSCGCLHHEKCIENGLKRKHNTYDLESEEYGIGYTSSNYKFIFDKEDYNLIKDYCWHRHNDGYLRTCYDYYYDDNNKRHNKYIMIHQLIQRAYGYDLDKYFDHINGDPTDNRKENLRLVTHQKNMLNTKNYITNTSGHKGVHFSKNEKKWKAYVALEGKKYHLGTFNTYEEAVEARENFDKEHYYEFRRKEKQVS